MVTNKKFKRRATNPDGHNEGDLIRLVIAFLSKNGYRVWRHQNTGRIDEAVAVENIEKYILSLSQKKEFSSGLVKKQLGEILKSSYKRVTGTLQGVPDIVGYNTQTSKNIGLEVKINADTLSDAQKRFKQELIEAGGEWFEVRSYDVFLQQFYKRKNSRIIDEKIEVSLFS